MESVVNNYIAADDSGMSLALSSGDPAEVLTYIEAHPDMYRLYFIDIGLKHDEMDGIMLGTKIREADSLAKIVFVTVHSEQAYLTFYHKINALDFIVKGRREDIETRMNQCIIDAHKLYLDEKRGQVKYFRIDASGEVWSVPWDDILFFETHVSVRHKIILHTENSRIEFRGFLGEIEKHIPGLYRCHKSYLLNISKVAYIDRKTKEAVMPNGMRVHIAQKKMPEIVGMIGNG